MIRKEKYTVDKQLVIGLDIGETSVGWTITDMLNEYIVDMGVRVWDKAQTRTKQTLASERREYRGRRRTGRRKIHRKDRVKNALIRYELLTKDQVNNLFLNSGNEDVYVLRVQALDKLISNEELARILIKFAKNRGFKSNRKVDVDSEGVILTAIDENQKLMNEKNYRTFGEMLLLDEKFKYKKRNTEGDYQASPSRKLIEDELDMILTTQQNKGNNLITDDFMKDIMCIILEQRPFATGDDIVKLLGKCTYEVDEYRAPKATHSFSEFQVRQALNNLRLLDQDFNKTELNPEQKEAVYQKAFSGSGKLTFTQLRKILKMDEAWRFIGLDYGPDIKDVEKKSFVSIEEFMKIQKQVKEFNLRNEQLDDIGWVLSFYKTDEDIYNELVKRELSEEVIEKALAINIKSSKPCNLSLKALININVGLKEGLLYHEACDKAGYKSEDKEERTLLLEKEISRDEITNPVVFKSLIETKKVLNALILRYGSPISVHIELAREVTMSEKGKIKAHKKSKENEKLNLSIIGEIKKERPDINLNSTQIMRYKLWKEQNGLCMYSNKPIDVDYVLFDGVECQIDHILPYSRSYDNSYTNKVLVFTKYNQDKGNKTPHEMFSEVAWEEFKERVNSNTKIPYKKKLNLLNTTFKDNEAGFLSRNLINTAYAARYFSKLVRDNLLFSPSERKNKVVCINGRATSDFRYLLDIKKDRDIHTHHAIDAAIISVIDEKFIYNLNNYYKKRENDRYKAGAPGGLKFEKPWENFDYEIMKKEKEIFVSKAEKTKVTGSASKDTFYSYKKGKDENGCHIVGKNVPITKLTIDKNNELVAGNSGKIDPAHPLYNVIYEAIKSGTDLNNLVTPSKKGNGNPIRKVMVHKAVVSGKVIVFNDTKSAKLGGDMVRTDVFEKEGKFLFVPIYVSDVVGSELPCLAITKKKPRDQWITIDDSYKFKCSISKNSLIKVIRKNKDELIEHLGYVASNPDVFEARFKMIHHDGEDLGAIPFSSIADIKKYKIDILGNFEEIINEERKKFG